MADRLCHHGAMSNTPHTQAQTLSTSPGWPTAPQSRELQIGSSPPRTLYIVPERRTPRAGHVPVGRALHLVDIENLMGGPFAGIDAMTEAAAQYRQAAWVQEDDHVWIGVNPGLMIEAQTSWQGCRLLVGGGKDGADKALIREVSDAVRIASLYDRLMIGSGDGIFQIVAAAFTALGIPVGVVSRPRSLAHLLAESASFVRYVTTTAALGGAA